MKAGDLVALAQVGATLPNGMRIERSKIRGVVSDGMLCSEEELKLKDKSEGILMLPPETKPGQPLAEILGRDDTILVQAHRQPRRLPEPLRDGARSGGGARPKAGAAPRRRRAAPLARLSPIAIHLDAGEGAPQFFGLSIEGVKIGPSPAWAVKRLEALGSRSINNVVDASNLVMLELGHPMHAYDADLLQGKEIRVRLARAGESLLLLDGQTIELAGTELVIADGAPGTAGGKAVGLAWLSWAAATPRCATRPRGCSWSAPSFSRGSCASRGRAATSACTDAAQRASRRASHPMGLSARDHAAGRELDRRARRAARSPARASLQLPSRISASWLQED